MLGKRVINNNYPSNVVLSSNANTIKFYAFYHKDYGPMLLKKIVHWKFISLNYNEINVQYENHTFEQTIQRACEEYKVLEFEDLADVCSWYLKFIEDI